MTAQIKAKLQYDLNTSYYSIYHRAALAGLASTIKAWRQNGPPDLHCEVSSSTVEIGWTDNISDVEALKRLLAWSFRISDDGVIDLPGQQFGARKDLQIMNHYALLHSFLQHSHSRSCEPELRKITLDCGTSELPLHLQYAAVTRFAHQTALGTRLFSNKDNANFPSEALITQALVPGILLKRYPLTCSAQDAILLLFVCVGSSLFKLQPFIPDKTSQISILIPEVRNLLEFVSQRVRLHNATPFRLFRTNSYEGRIAGNSDAAALSFFMDAKALGAPDSWCQTVTMGKLKWESYQLHRTGVATPTSSHLLPQFELTSRQFKRCIHILDKNFNSFLFPATVLIELIADNSLSHRKWYHKIESLIQVDSCFDHFWLNQRALAQLKASLSEPGEIMTASTFECAVQLFLQDEALSNQNYPDKSIKTKIVVLKNSILRLRGAEQTLNWFFTFLRRHSAGVNYFKPNTNSKASFQLSEFRDMRNWLVLQDDSDVRSLLILTLMATPRTFRTPTETGME